MKYLKSIIILYFVKYNYFGILTLELSDISFVFELSQLLLLVLYANERWFNQIYIIIYVYNYIQCTNVTWLRQIYHCGKQSWFWLNYLDHLSLCNLYFVINYNFDAISHLNKFKNWFRHLFDDKNIKI